MIKSLRRLLPARLFLWQPRLLYGRNTGSRQNLIIMSLVFIVFIRIPLSIDQLAIMAADCCSTDTLVYRIAYFKYGSVIDVLINRTRLLGPDNVPCGTPPLGYPGCDTDSPFLTVCSRSRRKAAIHQTMCAGTFMATSLLINVSSYTLRHIQRYTPITVYQTALFKTIKILIDLVISW